MCFVIYFQAVPSSQRGRVVKNGEVFLRRKVVAAGVRIEIKRPERQRAFVLLLEAGRVFSDGSAARPPLLGNHLQSQFIECLAGAFTGF